MAENSNVFPSIKIGTFDDAVSAESLCLSLFPAAEDILTCAEEEKGLVRVSFAGRVVTRHNNCNVFRQFNSQQNTKKSAFQRTCRLAAP